MHSGIITLLIKLVKNGEDFYKGFVVGETAVQVLFEFVPSCYQQLFTKLTDQPRYFGQDCYGGSYKTI